MFSNEILGPKQIFCAEIFWSKIDFGYKNHSKKFWIQRIFGPKKFGLKKNLGQKKVWVKKHFGAENVGVGAEGQLECLDIPCTTTNKVHLPLRSKISLYHTSPGGWVAGWLAS